MYENAYKEILQINNYCKITTNNYIDTTLIVNKCGVEGICYGCSESRKKYTFIAVVCNENIKPISILCSLNYTKKLNETMKEKIKSKIFLLHPKTTKMCHLKMNE